MAQIFKALSEETRLRILSLLLDGELCVCDIEASLRLTQSNTSRHLNILKKNGILISYKQAQWTYYRFDEKFKEDHRDLWLYLEERLKGLATFKADRDALYHCKKENKNC